MSSETRQNERKGSLDDRVLALEKSLLYRWDNWFGKNPGIVLGVVVSTLFLGFWAYIERIDKQHHQEISRVIKENESKINWLKEQEKTKLDTENKKCAIEKQRISLKLESCVKSRKK